MAIYEYNCALGEHQITEVFKMGSAPESWFCCVHQAECPRYFGSVVAIANSDEFRKAWLSSKAQGNPQEQSPRDAAEAKAMGKALGRKYIGNKPLENGMQITPEIQKKLYG